MEMASARAPWRHRELECVTVEHDRRQCGRRCRDRDHRRGDPVHDSVADEPPVVVPVGQDAVRLAEVQIRDDEKGDGDAARLRRRPCLRPNLRS
jgi:hypothetical protein